MGLADEALMARRAGERERAIAALRDAFEHEREAAALLSSSLGLEPTRSVLHRSAASLALECGETRAAERLIGAALYGNPPDEIADELRDLLEQVYFQRHLKARGVILQRDEFQMSLAGASVGFGLSESGEFVGRVKDFETLIYRTAERKLGRPYREAGRRQATLERDVQLYLSIPRAASFAVTFRLGRKEQLDLPGMDFAKEVIDEVLDCFVLFSKAQYPSLIERMPDTYLRNFIGLARQISPDGEEIKLVGLTARREERERQVVLNTPRRQIPLLEKVLHDDIKATDSVTITVSDSARIQVRGTLRLADSRDEQQGVIELIERGGLSHRVRVPPGMMSDIVRPMYEEEVIVSGRETGSEILLETIDRAT
jgi:hypothetical protein